MIFRVDVQTSLWSCPSDSLNCIDLSLPAWIDGQYGLMSDAVQSTIRQFRILLECFFILFIMAGYYESVKLCLKFCYFFIQNPKN
uniref:Uncharacterized protein n=1 Tax=Panagrolaimus davidi TaxID=227884 RepID=A0A914QKI5_9BILA